MMPDSPRTHKAVVISSFKDAGTGESFNEGDTPAIEAGAFANYEHAGLVRKHTAADAKADDAKAKSAA